MLEANASDCAVCHRTVYKVEELKSQIGIIHKLCYFCTTCKKRAPQWEPDSLRNILGELYCEACQAKSELEQEHNKELEKIEKEKKKLEDEAKSMAAGLNGQVTGQNGNGNLYSTPTNLNGAATPGTKKKKRSKSKSKDYDNTLTTPSEKLLTKSISKPEPQLLKPSSSISHTQTFPTTLHTNLRLSLSNTACPHPSVSSPPVTSIFNTLPNYPSFNFPTQPNFPGFTQPNGLNGGLNGLNGVSPNLLAPNLLTPNLFSFNTNTTLPKMDGQVANLDNGMANMSFGTDESGLTKKKSLKKKTGSIKKKKKTEGEGDDATKTKKKTKKKKDAGLEANPGQMLPGQMLPMQPIIGPNGQPMLLPNGQPMMGPGGQLMPMNGAPPGGMPGMPGMPNMPSMPTGPNGMPLPLKPVMGPNGQPILLPNGQPMVAPGGVMPQPPMGMPPMGMPPNGMPPNGMPPNGMPPNGLGGPLPGMPGALPGGPPEPLQPIIGPNGQPLLLPNGQPMMGPGGKMMAPPAGLPMGANGQPLPLKPVLGPNGQPIMGPNGMPLLGPDGKMPPGLGPDGKPLPIGAAATETSPTTSTPKGKKAKAAAAAAAAEAAAAKKKEEEAKKPVVNSKFKFLQKAREVCVNCQKTVYAAEKTLGPKNKIYHKLCLRCLSCNRGLQSGGFVDHDDEPFCKGCYAKYFGPRGVGFGALSFAN